MKILVVNYEYPPVGGGGGAVSKTLAESLASRGHQVRVITSALKGLTKHETLGGVEVYRRFAFRARADRCSVPEMIAYLITHLVPVASQVIRWRPDVIHAHFAVPSGILAWLIGFLTRTPYVLTAHLGDVPGGVPDQTDTWFRWLKPFTVPLWRMAAARTAVSSFVRQLAEKAYQQPVTVVPNGVAISWKQAVAKQIGNPVRLVFAGRFNPQKNLHILLDALGVIRDLPWRCSLIGDGPERKRLERQLEALELTDRVSLTGWLSKRETSRCLRKQDMLILPSSSEGMPVVAVEGLVYGLVLVGSDIGGLEECIESGSNGFLVPSGDILALAKSLARLIQNREEMTRMSLASRHLALRFSLEKVVDQYESILEGARKK